MDSLPEKYQKYLRFEKGTESFNSIGRKLNSAAGELLSEGLDIGWNFETDGSEVLLTVYADEPRSLPEDQEEIENTLRQQLKKYDVNMAYQVDIYSR